VFFGNKKHNQAAVCEICGHSGHDINYRFFTEIAYCTYLHSRQVARVDDARNIVVMSNGQEVPFDLRGDSDAIKLKPHMVPHLVCGDSCVESLCRPPFQIRPDMIHSMPVVSAALIEGGMFWPHSFKEEQIETKKSKCSVCGGSFPNATKKFTTIRIASSEETNGVADEFARKGGFDFVEAKTPGDVGKLWGYRFDKGLMRNDLEFCSNECMFDYCTSRRAVVIYPNIVLQGFMAIVTPNMTAINLALGNSYKYRPTKMSPL